MIKMATMLTVKDLAATLDTDPRTTRKFLRSITPADEQPGKGSRWEVPATAKRSLQAKFKKYTADLAQAAQAPEDTDPKVGEVETQHDAEVAELTD